MFPLKDNIPTRRFPVLTVALIVANVFIYFALQSGGFSAPNEQSAVWPTGEYAVVPKEVTHPGEDCGVDFSCPAVQQGSTDGGPDQVPWYLTIFTAMFMHGSVLHLAGNMLFLWIFGNNIEDSMSRWRFILFYLAGGVMAFLAQTALDPDSTVPTLGASGAVAAVLGAYLLLYPRARVVTAIFLFIFFTFVELPALVVLGLWFVLQALYAGADVFAPAGGEGGGVAYMAHVGGFVFGLIVIKLIANERHEDPYPDRRIPVY